jgi:glycosyltransferase involved in cell wall biosynthesis
LSLRVLHVGPLPPTPTGVADYAADLLPHLAARLDLTVALSDDAPDPGWPGFLRRSEVDAAAYDVILYQLGNHRFHADALTMLLEWPGVVVLHDAVLHHLHADALLARGRAGAYVREAAFAGGLPSARRAVDTALGLAPPAWHDEPMIARAVRAATGVIVHSDFARQAVLRADPGARVTTIHHGVAAPVEIREPDGPFTVGVFGGLTPEKRINSVVRAMAALPDARLLLVGEPSPALQLDVPTTGRVTLAEMERLIAECHVCVQLRWPTAGEASGAVLRCLRQGRPTIVSDVGWFGELPDDAVLKLPAGLDETAEADLLASALRELRDHPGRRAALATAARRFCAACSWPAAADQYVEALSGGKGGARGIERGRPGRRDGPQGENGLAPARRSAPSP